MSSIKHVQKFFILNFGLASAQTNICTYKLFLLATLFEFQKLSLRKITSGRAISSQVICKSVIRCFKQRHSIWNPRKVLATMMNQIYDISWHLYLSVHEV